MIPKISQPLAIQNQHWRRLHKQDKATRAFRQMKKRMKNLSVR
ncbi:hypothetical protein I3255_06120 [Psychrobacter sp. Ps6]|nr:hypothetical protein [Psychrobacter sp. Ps6]